MDLHLRSSIVTKAEGKLRGNNNHGFTVIELITGALIFTILAAASANLLLHCSGQYAALAAKNELLENSRITMDFIINECRLAEDLVIAKYRTTDTLYYLDITRGGHTYQIYYDNTKNITDKYYQTVRYGGYNDNNDDQSHTQVLAKFIDDITVTVDNDAQLCYITVRTSGRVGNTSVSPITLYGEVGLKNTPYIVIG